MDAVISPPNLTSWQGCGVILTHGAGGDMHHKHLEALAKHLCNAGILCLRFTMKTPNFKYRVKCFATVVVSRLKIKSFTSIKLLCLFTCRKGCCNFKFHVQISQLLIVLLKKEPLNNHVFVCFRIF